MVVLHRTVTGYGAGYNKTPLRLLINRFFFGTNNYRLMVPGLKVF